jgi:MYXO-CTERM domain-containing protein
MLGGLHALDVKERGCALVERTLAPIRRQESRHFREGKDPQDQRIGGALFAPQKSGRRYGVVGVYRHSYHAALVSPELYEWTQRAIFNHSLLEPWDEKRVRKFITKELAAPPGPLETHVDSDFFRQHVALELLIHQGGAGISAKAILPLLEPYLEDSGFHPQISAVRALSAVHGEASTERLLRFVEKPEREGFAKVMAIGDLEYRRTKKVQIRLEAYQAVAETEEIGFGGNIMDPRIGTYFPDSVKSSIDNVLEHWGPLSTAPDTLESQEPVAKTTASDKVVPASPAVSQKKVGCASCSSGGASGSGSILLLLLVALCFHRRRREAH